MAHVTLPITITWPDPCTCPATLAQALVLRSWSYYPLLIAALPRPIAGSNHRHHVESSVQQPCSNVQVQRGSPRMLPASLTGPGMLQCSSIWWIHVELTLCSTCLDRRCLLMLQPSRRSCGSHPPAVSLKDLTVCALPPEAPREVKGQCSSFPARSTSANRACNACSSWLRLRSTSHMLLAHIYVPVADRLFDVLALQLNVAETVYRNYQKMTVQVSSCCAS